MDTGTRGMNRSGRFALILGLSLAAGATTYAGAALDWWLQHTFDQSAYSLVWAHALQRTVQCTIWLLPLLFFPKLRDVGSFRLPPTWTVLIVVPAIALNLLFFGRYPTFPWQVSFSFVLYGMAIGVFEEVVFRGYAFRHSPERHPRLVVFISAACFMALHLLNLGHQSLPMVLASLPFVFALGLGFGIIRIVSGSLAWCMLLHGALDSANQFSKSGPLVDQWLPLTWGIMGIAGVLAFWLHPKFRPPLSADTSTECA